MSRVFRERHMGDVHTYHGGEQPIWGGTGCLQPRELLEIAELYIRERAGAGGGMKRQHRWFQGSEDLHVA